MKKVAILPILALALLPFGAPSALADDSVCVGLLPPGTHDNVVVPPGASCNIFGPGITIRGSIKALENSALDVRDTDIAGNVHGDRAEDFFVINNVIGGNVEVKEGEASSASLDVLISLNRFQKGPFSLLPGQFTWGNIKVEKMRGDIFVQGNVGVQNIQLQENTAFGGVFNEELRLQNNSVAGNAQVFKTMGNGDKFVTGNTVGGNLQCTQNDPPFLSLGNTADQFEGQCPA